MVRRNERARTIAAGRPLLSGDPATVTWLTGVAPDVEWGPSPFSAPPLVLLDPGGSTLAIVSDDEAAGGLEGVELRTFPGFALEDVDRPRIAADLALEALAGAGSVACDLATLPGLLAVELHRRDVDLADVGAELRAARAVKDADELDAIRGSIAITDAGQAQARASVAAGRTELDLWTETRAAMERRAGSRLPVLADFVSGERTAEIGGPPSERVVGEGDLVLVDLVPRLGGYWADSCSTLVVGEPPPPAREAHARARAALERALETIRPGIRAGDLDAAVREASPGYPHHTGHGVGTTTHEQPRIVPGSDRMLEPGMVIALEPGAYGEDWGVRVEHVVVVTEDGCDVLSGHSLEL